MENKNQNQNLNELEECSCGCGGSPYSCDESYNRAQEAKGERTLEQVREAMGYGDVDDGSQDEPSWY